MCLHPIFNVNETPCTLTIRFCRTNTRSQSLRRSFSRPLYGPFFTADDCYYRFPVSGQYKAAAVLRLDLLGQEEVATEVVKRACYQKPYSFQNAWEQGAGDVLCQDGGDLVTGQERFILHPNLPHNFIGHPES